MKGVGNVFLTTGHQRPLIDKPFRETHVIVWFVLFSFFFFFLRRGGGRWYYWFLNCSITYAVVYCYKLFLIHKDRFTLYASEKHFRPVILRLEITC